jgi:hypothetical protein
MGNIGGEYFHSYAKKNSKTCPQTSRCEIKLEFKYF